LKALRPKCYPRQNEMPNVMKIKSKVWVYHGDTSHSSNAKAMRGAWHFITIPKNRSREISARFRALKRGWGSLPVIATIGQTSWKTSIFPDNKTKTYLLPLKASVRRSADIMSGDTITINLSVSVFPNRNSNDSIK
jgi:hypothetical protein